MSFAPPTILPTFGVAFVFLLGVVCGNCGRSIAVAQIDDEVQAYARALARTTVNEAGPDSPPDMRLIHQAATCNGTRDNGAALRWLRRHSARVNGNAPCASGRNCVWTRNLMWGSTRPVGFPRRVRWFPVMWSRVRTQALDLARNGDPSHVCPVSIFTWGSARDFEVNRFGWIRVDCGARNFGGTTRRAMRLALADEAR